MEINSNNSSTQPPSAAQVKATALSLQVGQMLRAIVIESAQNSVKLRIDNALVQAPTTRQHTAGETLLLSVVRGGEKPVLRVHNLPSQNTAPTQVTQENALKVALPRQSPVTLLLANLSAATQLKTQQAATLPFEVTDNIKKLLNNLTDAQQIKNPAVLKQAINNSGLLFEQKLARLFSPQSNRSQSSSSASSSTTSFSSTPPTLQSILSQDFKGNLLQLLGNLKQQATPGGLPTRQSQLHQAIQSGTTVQPGILPQNKNGAQTLQQSLQLAVKESTSRTISGAESTTTADEGEERLLTSQRPRELSSFSSLKPAPFPFLRHMPLVVQKAQQATLPMMQFREQIIDELIRQIEGASARIQLSQLASLPQENAPQQPSWTFELPLRHGETVNVVQMRIEKDGSQEEDEKEARWRVTLTLDLEEIGTIYALITIQGENASTTLWAEEIETLSLIEQNLTILRDAIEQHGINASELKCQQGTPPQPQQPRRHTLLVDAQV